MKQYLVGINLNSNELQNARIHNVETLPASAVPGQVAFNTNNNDNRLYVFNGTSWVTWAPINHASPSETFGRATDSNFGHVKLTDTFPYSDDGTASTGGVAVTPTALAAAYNTFTNVVTSTLLSASADSIPTVGAIVNSSTGVIPYIYAQTVTSSISSDVNTSSYLTTQSAVYTFVKAELADLDAMRFMGVVSSAGDLPLATASVRAGDTYRATSAFTIGSTSTASSNPEEVESGDLIIATASTPIWTVAQTNIEGAITSITTDSNLNATRQGVYTVSIGLENQGITTGTYGSTAVITTIPSSGNVIQPAFGQAIEFPVVGAKPQGTMSSIQAVTMVIPSTTATSNRNGLMTFAMYTKLSKGLMYSTTGIAAGDTSSFVPYNIYGYQATMATGTTGVNEEVVLDCRRTISGTIFAIAQSVSKFITIAYYISSTSSITTGGGDNTQ